MSQPASTGDALVMLDLFAGLGGASAAMRDRGWNVVTVDNDPTFGTDIIADLTTWTWTGPRPTLIWASPPCDQFSRESMPWCKTGAIPSMTLVEAARRIVAACRPRYWVLENVRGALPYLGPPREIHGPFYLWGYFPSLGRPALHMRKKESYHSSQRAERARVPLAVSLALAVAVESQAMLLEVA